ncbi:hypothetical protein NUW54_g4450 [Trametes sanguinea]|uniref:Uncharacterized protein n=1 Tax=Trametes sanguinea TaxID=158606 RepID=A0ACC1Q0N3_9APHY|nr:hypothetical protein NUW54_g4450 [Trametes sanguinea]
MPGALRPMANRRTAGCTAQPPDVTLVMHMRAPRGQRSWQPGAQASQQAQHGNGIPGMFELRKQRRGQKGPDEKPARRAVRSAREIRVW